MNRQRVLTRDEPLALAVILDEAVLYHQVGGPEVMRRQSRYLVEAGDRPNIALQVLPNAVGAHPAVLGSFEIASFPGLAATDVVHLENLTGSMYVEREGDVFRYTLAFDQLRRLALSAEESRGLIERQAAIAD
jgi:Domain of unknown function (DUF5753)